MIETSNFHLKDKLLTYETFLQYLYFWDFIVKDAHEQCLIINLISDFIRMMMHPIYQASNLVNIKKIIVDCIVF